MAGVLSVGGWGKYAGQRAETDQDQAPDDGGTYGRIFSYHVHDVPTPSHSFWPGPRSWRARVSMQPGYPEPRLSGAGWGIFG
ncbi:hypothetical protein NITHO_5120011 [Nitrolancea hollandica Lb]|uniref:Uncharacterized protein n=1 Tax=Nitrolancea hollandica Lb TaxID=1129897 RepID=I4ELH8_9BACT|nr:hypothetical protein NITHO_5120011 [Nitrolancea hollandica Lb]